MNGRPSRMTVQNGKLRLQWWIVELLQIGSNEHASLLALQSYQDALKTENGLEIAQATLLLGVCFSRRRMLNEAKTCAEDCEVKLSSLDVRVKERIELFSALGELYCTIGMATRAVKMFERVCEFCEEIYGSEHLATSDAYSLLGCCFGSLGALDGALEFCEKALFIRNKKTGEQQQYLANSYYNVGVILRMLGQLNLARQRISAAHKIRTNVYGGFSLPTAEVEISLGQTQEQRGYYHDAANRYERAYRIRQKILGETNPLCIEAFSLMESAVTMSKNNREVRSCTKYYTVTEIETAIKELNFCVRLKNAARRCNYLNPYLQAELVATLALGNFDVAGIRRRFQYHVDLIDRLVEFMDPKEVCGIGVLSIFETIERCLLKVTENELIPHSVCENILTACPISIQKLQNLFAGEGALQKKIYALIDALTSQRGVQKVPHTKYIRVTNLQRLIVAICKINAESLSSGLMPLVPPATTEKLLNACSYSLSDTSIMQIIEETETGEAIIRQLAADNLMLENFFRSGNNEDDNDIYSAQDIFVAFTLMREMNPDIRFSSFALSKLIKKAAKGLLSARQIAAIFGENEEIYRLWFLPFLQLVGISSGFCSFRPKAKDTTRGHFASFINGVKIANTDSTIGEFRLRKKRNRDIFCREIASCTQAQISKIPANVGQINIFTDSKNAEEQSESEPAALFEDSQLIGSVKLAIQRLPKNVGDQQVFGSILEDIYFSRIKSVASLSMLVRGGSYGEFEGKEMFLSSVNDNLILAGSQKKDFPESNNSDVMQSNNPYIEAVPLKLQAKLSYLATLKLKYPHLSGVFEEVEKDLHLLPDDYVAANNDSFEDKQNKNMIKNEAKCSVVPGRRLKMVPMTAVELWALVQSKLFIFGAFNRAVRIQKYRLCREKIKLVGIFTRLCELARMRVPCLKLFSLSLFSYFSRSKTLGLSSLQNPQRSSMRNKNKSKIPYQKYDGPKLRALHWATVNEEQTKGTIWEGRKRTFSTVQHMFVDVEEIFAPNSSNPKKITAKASAKKKTALSFLDPKRTQNLGIALARVWSGSFVDLANAITHLKADLIGLDNVEKLLKIAPTKEEISLVSAYNGDVILLNKADRFVHEISTVQRLSGRLEIMLFCGRFNDQKGAISGNIDTIKDASEELSRSERLPEFLGIILSLGNKLNQNTRKQLAAGIKIDSLTKLATTKGKTGVTVLEYMVENLLKRSPNILDLSQDFTHLKAASTINYGTMQNDIRKLHGGVNLLSRHLSIDEEKGEDIFACQYGAFFERASIQMQEMQTKFDAMTEAYNILSLWLGEDPKKTEPAVLFNQILNFLAAVNNAKIKVQEKHKRLKKSLRREEEKKIQIKNSSIAQKQKPTQSLLNDSQEIERHEKKSRRYSVDAWAEEED